MASGVVAIGAVVAIAVTVVASRRLAQPTSASTPSSLAPVDFPYRTIPAPLAPTDDGAVVAATPTTDPMGTNDTDEGTTGPTNDALRLLVARPAGLAFHGPSWAEISGDGQTAFVRTDDPLLPGVLPGDARLRLYAIDITHGGVRLVSDDHSLEASAVSYDGSFIVGAQGSTSDDVHVVRIDTATGRTTPLLPASVAGRIHDADISADGSTLAISLEPAGGPPSHEVVYLVDLVTGAVDDSLTSADGALFDVHLSANGSVLAFTSTATNLPVGPGARSTESDAVVLDRVTKTMRFAYSTVDGATANDQSAVRGISWDGTIVTIASAATDLTTLPLQHDAVAFRPYQFNRTTGQTTAIATAGVPGDPQVTAVEASADASRVILGGNAVQTVYLDTVETGQVRDLLAPTGGQSPGRVVSASRRDVSISAAGTLALVIVQSPHSPTGGVGVYADLYVWTSPDASTVVAPQLSSTADGTDSQSTATSPPPAMPPSQQPAAQPVSVQPIKKWQVAAPGKFKWMVFGPDTIYVSIPQGDSYTILAIDPSTGAQKWATTPRAGQITNGSFALVGDEIVALYGDDTHQSTTFVFFDPATGAPLGTASEAISQAAMVSGNFLVDRGAHGNELRTIDPAARTISDPIPITYYFALDDGTLVVEKDGVLTVRDPVTLQELPGLHYVEGTDFDTITQTYDGQFIVGHGGLISGLAPDSSIAWTIDPQLDPGLTFAPLNASDLILVTSSHGTRVLQLSGSNSHLLAQTVEGYAQAGGRSIDAVPTFLVADTTGNHIATIHDGTIAFVGTYPDAIDDPNVVVNGNVLYVWERFGSATNPDQPSPLIAYDATTGTPLWTLNVDSDQHVTFPPGGVALSSYGTDRSVMTFYSPG